VGRAGQSLHLTPIEYRSLTQLTAHLHSVRTDRQVLNAVWGSSHAEGTLYVRVYMGHLRRKVEIDNWQPWHLLPGPASATTSSPEGGLTPANDR
jgi:two-component system KDP operon response regulator KdpE